MRKAVLAIAAMIACCFSQPSRALDISKFMQLFALGSHAAIHLNGNTILVDDFSRDMRVDDNKLFINYWFNSVFQGGAFYLLSSPDGNNRTGRIIYFDHQPGNSWVAVVHLDCIIRSEGDCNNSRDGGYLDITGPTLPNDAPCNCWHHLMMSINSSIPRATFALDGIPGTASIVSTGNSFPTNWVGPGGTIRYSLAGTWYLGESYAGDLAEFYFNNLQLFDPTVIANRDKFRYPEKNQAKGLGYADVLHTACEIPGSIPELCLRGNINNFTVQESIAGQPSRHHFTVEGSPIEQALSDPCAFSLWAGCVGPEIRQ